MGPHLASKSSSVLLLLLALAVSIACLPSVARAQKAHAKLTVQDIVNLLTNDTENDDVAAAAQAEGISFQVTPAVEQRIRGAGGNDNLIGVLKSIQPHGSSPEPVPSSASPPALMVESRPGQCQVYVDDEPVGSTSPEGRLKMTHLTPGPHHVRVSQSGYQDFEQDVTLTEGQLSTVEASLAKSSPIPVPPPPHPVQNPGYLGVQATGQQNGSPGVLVSNVAAGGPAAQAGIRAGDVIVAVNGQQVNAPQELRAALSSHPAGDVVQITWAEGTNSITRPVQLGSPSPIPQPPVPRPQGQVTSFAVAHDHGQSGQTYCTGIMTIGNGMIIYRGTGGATPHNFEIPLNTVREARRNNVYLVAYGAFHIRTKKNSNFNFVALDQQGKPTTPDAVLTAIDSAIGR